MGIYRCTEPIEQSDHGVAIELSSKRQPPKCWHFRENTIDREIWRCVVEEDEYRIGSIDFEPTDVVLDVGAHIGCFSWWAWQRGSRRISAFEPDQWNHWLLRMNTTLSGCRIDAKSWAIVGSTDMGLPMLGGTLENPTNYNTGGGDILNEGRSSYYCKALGDVLSSGSFRFLKLDCEGCEFPAILTAGESIRNVQQIAGEYHELGPGTFHEYRKSIPQWATIPGVPSWTRDVLRDFLTEQGFDVEINHEAENIGKFFAINKAIPSR